MVHQRSRRWCTFTFLCWAWALTLGLSAAAAATATVPERGQPFRDPSLAEVLTFLQQWQTPQLRSDAGTCSFPAGTDNVEVQGFMNQGVCLLHAFSDFEALLSFGRVISLDPELALGYWGLHNALKWDDGYRRARREALGLAVEKLRKVDQPDERTRLYIEAELPEADFDANYMRLVDEFDDMEAAGIWVWKIISETVDRMGGPLPGRERMLPLLSLLKRKRPDHHVTHHMHIHGWEDTLRPEEALEDVQKIREHAGSLTVGHITHMPGHIMHLLADFRQSRKDFEAALAHDLESLERVGGLEFYWNYIHNAAFLVATMAEAGQRLEMRKWALDLQTRAPSLEKELVLDWSPEVNRAAARYFLQGLPAAALGWLRLEEPGLAAENLQQLQLRFRPLYPDTSANWWIMEYYEALRQYSLGMERMQLVLRQPGSSVCRCPLQQQQQQQQQRPPAGNVAVSDGDAAATGIEQEHLEAARSHFVKLKELVELLHEPMAGETEFGYSVGRRSYLALNVSKHELGALVDWGQGRIPAEQAVIQLEAASAEELALPYNEPTAYPRPVLMSRADVESCGCRFAAAVQTYRRVLAAHDHKGDGWAWHGLAQAQLAIGGPSAAAQAEASYRSLLGFWRDADPSLLPVREAHRFLESAKRPRGPSGGGSPVELTGLGISAIILACLLAGVAAAWAWVRFTGRRLVSGAQLKELTERTQDGGGKYYRHADSFSTAEEDCDSDLYHILPVN